MLGRAIGKIFSQWGCEFTVLRCSDGEVLYCWLYTFSNIILYIVHTWFIPFYKLYFKVLIIILFVVRFSKVLINMAVSMLSCCFSLLSYIIDWSIIYLITNEALPGALISWWTMWRVVSIAVGVMVSITILAGLTSLIQWMWLLIIVMMICIVCVNRM